MACQRMFMQTITLTNVSIKHRGFLANRISWYISTIYSILNKDIHLSFMLQTPDLPHTHPLQSLTHSRTFSLALVLWESLSVSHGLLFSWSCRVCITILSLPQYKTRSFHSRTMASLAELEAQLAEVKPKLIEAKKVDKNSDEAKAFTMQLLDLKKAITAIDPNHPDANKAKKDKKKKAAAGGPKPLSKKELRMIEREKKMKEEAEKKAKVAADAGNFGELPMIMSSGTTGRSWTRVEDLSKDMIGQTVLIRASLHQVRDQNKIVFFELRSKTYIVQTALFQNKEHPKEMLKFAANIPRESIVDVEGVVQGVEEEIKSATQRDVEVHVNSVFIVSKSLPELPFSVVEASKPGSMLFDEGQLLASKDNAESEKDVKKQNKVGLNTRLNYRWIDVRTPAHQSILRVQSCVSNLFREFLYKRDFVEVHTPKLNAGASEGGANCFTLDYFGTPACLAQSPQLYKQMTSACSGLGRVFEIGPVFRAEDSHTHRHLCEFTGLDMEMEIKEHYFECLEVFSDLFISIFEGIEERCAHELNLIAQMYPVEKFKFLKPSLRLTFAEGCALLREHGISDFERDTLGITPQGEFEDLSTPNEKLLGRIVKEKYGTDFFMMDEYPLAARPFYTMPHPTNPKLSNSYDFFMRGEEIMSGAQRVHDAEYLVKRCKTAGSHGDPMTDEAINDMKGYIDSFRHGAVPHAGGGVGLERVVMLFLGLKNIRLASFFPRDPKRISP